jgi:hypothetical protein
MAKMTHQKFCAMINLLCTMSELIAWDQAGTPNPKVEERHLTERAELRDKLLRWSSENATLPGEIQ